MADRATSSLFKEHKLYQDEEVELRRKLDKFIADNAEEWDVKNTVRAATLDLSFSPASPA